MFSHILGMITIFAFVQNCCAYTDSQWIWYPEEARNEAKDSYRWMRRTFELSEKPVEAELWLLCDDRHRVWINGKGPLKIKSRLLNACQYDAADILKAGKNALAVEAYNVSGPAGVLAKLLLTLPNGENKSINSDSEWKVSKEKVEGWAYPEFDDVLWLGAKLVGHVFSRPWWGNSEWTPHSFFITADDRDRRESFMESIMADPEQFAKEPVNTYGIGYHQGMPSIFINASPVPAVWFIGREPKLDVAEKRISAFREAGIHLGGLSHRLDEFWTGTNEYNFEDLDNRIRFHLKVNPKAHLLVSVFLEPPAWWLNQNPDEWIGYASSDEYGGSKWGSKIAASMASQKWLKETGEAWRAMIRHIDGQPWGNRVMGWHPGYGISGEWHYYGSWKKPPQYPDTGPAMTKRFRNYLRDKYRDEKALRTAWKDSSITFETASVPGVEERRTGSRSSFRDVEKEQNVVDYYHCHQRVIADTIEYFCTIVKEETGGRAITGTWYGYFFVRPQTQGGHLEIERLLNSSHIDYFAVPHHYAFRKVGQDGRFRALSAGFREAGKVSVVEADSRTFLMPDKAAGRPDTLEGTIAVLRRELMTALIDKVAYWYVDFTRGYYDHPEIMAEIARLRGLWERGMENPGKSVAEIAVICDMESLYYLSDEEGMKLQWNLMRDNTTELYKVGAPFDYIFLSQLDTIDLSQYKLLIFLNTFQMSNNAASTVEHLRRSDRHAMIFMWAPGFTGPAGVSVERASKVTGFKLSAAERELLGNVTLTGGDDVIISKMSRTSYSWGSFEPVLIPDAGNGRVLGHFSEDESLRALVASGEGRRTVLYSAVPFLPRAVLLGMMKEAGVHQYVDNPNIVFRGDSRFLSLHTKLGGEVRVNLPGHFRVKDALTWEEIGAGESVFVNLPQKHTAILELERMHNP